MDTAADHSVGASSPRDKQRTTSHPAGTIASPIHERDIGALREQSLVRAAHALRTPLAVIKGSATTLLANAGQWDTATQQELLQLIDAQVDHLHGLVNGLLDVWRMNGGQLPVRLASTRVETLLTHVASRWRDRASDHALHVVHASPLPPVALDSERMEMAIERFLTYVVAGAQPHMPIRIEACAIGGELVVRISRAGIGWTPEECASFFDPFPTASAAQHPEAHLQLAEARAIVHAHGGRAAARTPETGAGLVLELTLPVGQVDELGPEASTPRPVMRRPVRRERPVVLIADDDAQFVRYLRTNLEAQGYRALSAPSAMQLVRLLDLEDPDLVLLDAQLGERIGTPAIERLPEYGSIPTIVLGRGEEAECVRSLDMGAVDYLAKPFGVQELLARMRAALRAVFRDAGQEEETIFRSGELTIDFAQRQVTVGDRPVQLSRTEYKLLRALAQQAGRVLSHELLLERVWGPGYGQEVEFLWVYVRRLRRKLEPDPRCPRYILTVPGVGYRLAQL